MNKSYSISSMLFQEIWVKTGPDQGRSSPNTTAETGFLRDAIIRLRLFRTKVVKHAPLKNDYSNTPNDYYIPVSDNTSDNIYNSPPTIVKRAEHNITPSATSVKQCLCFSFC